MRVSLDADWFNVLMRYCIEVPDGCPEMSRSCAVKIVCPPVSPWSEDGDNPKEVQVIPPSLLHSAVKSDPIVAVPTPLV